MTAATTAKIAEIIAYVRESHGLPLSSGSYQQILQDRGCVFHSVKMVFDADPLKEGEFAYMHQVDKDRNKGFMLYMHPFFKNRPNDLPYLVAYHLAIVNFAEEPTAEVAEHFGAALMGLEVELYYDKVNQLFESILTKSGCSL